MKTTPILITFALWGGLASAQTGPIAHYPFDSTTVDIGPNALHGTAYGSPIATSDRHGTPNGAIRLDGIDDHILLGTSTLLKPGTEVSVGIWAHMENWAALTTWGALISNTESGGYGLFVNGGAGVFESEVRRNGSYGIATYPLSSISAGWHHFAMTYDGRFNRLFIDGNAVATDDAGAIYAIDYSFPGNHTVVGAEAGPQFSEGDYFPGKIDDLRFYDRDLSTAEVQQLADFGTGLEHVAASSGSMTIYPTPSSGSAHLQLSLPVGGRGSATLSDLQGRVLQIMDLGMQSPGSQVHTMNLEGVLDGVYLCRVLVGSSTWTGKLSIAR